MNVAVTILDGGLSTALEEVGADIGGPLWTARAVIESPETLVEAHRRFVEAGARIVTTASYQCGVRQFEHAGLEASAARRALSSTVDLARRATEGTSARVAASIGPFGASSADGSEYTGIYGVPWEVVERYHREKIEVLVDSGADLFAVETIPSIGEARLIAEILEEWGAPPAWFCFGLVAESRTYGGDDLGEAIRTVAGYANAVALGANCTHPLVIDEALTTIAAHAGDAGVIVYPNRGRSWNAETRAWSGEVTDPFASDRVFEWIRRGVTLIGGCCGTGPDDIARLVAVATRAVA